MDINLLFKIATKIPIAAIYFMMDIKAIAYYIQMLHCFILVPFFVLASYPH